jgi:hypothetical protein
LPDLAARPIFLLELFFERFSTAANKQVALACITADTAYFEKVRCEWTFKADRKTFVRATHQCINSGLETAGIGNPS